MSLAHDFFFFFLIFLQWLLGAGGGKSRVGEVRYLLKKIQCLTLLEREENENKILNEYWVLPFRKST